MIKKILVLLLSVVLCLSASIPVLAETVSVSEEELSNAYIEFSERMADKGVAVSTCLEDFIASYEGTSEKHLEQYIEELIKKEFVVASKEAYTVSTNLQAAMEYYAVAGNDAGVEPCSVGGKWYDNIGDSSVSSPKLNHAASYNKYNILSTVKKGDIIEETEGLVAQVTGHIAVVQGKYWDSTYGQYYIRTIEAGIHGVVYGVLDDTRYDDRGVSVYYVTSATSTQKNDAVTFCKNQIGKPYWLAIPVLTRCNYSSSATNWYCSELVWAAYYNQGINLNGSSIPMNIYMPATLAASSKLTSRSVT